MLARIRLGNLGSTLVQIIIAAYLGTDNHLLEDATLFEIF